MILKNLNKIPKTSISRNKQVIKIPLLINNEIPNVTNFAQVTFPPNQGDPAHVHQDMYELFLVIKGTGQVEVNNKTYQLTVGDFVVIEPNESHFIKNLSKQNLELICLGFKNN